MNRKGLFIIFFILSWFTIRAQSHTTVLYGRVLDSLSNAPLAGVNIYIKELQKGIATDSSGTFSLTLSSSKTYTLRASHVGYHFYQQKMVMNADKHIHIKLTPLSYKSEEVTIRAVKENNNIVSTQTGTNKLSIKEIEKLPVFMGEVDPLKTIQLLPGIQSAGSSNMGGLFVRGSSPGQNMILFDNAVVFNPYHLMGFFSVFNGDAIQDIQLISSGMPAKYGGRLASLIEVESKTGNFSNYSAKGNIGLIATKFLAQGPIIKNKASFAISGRRTYFDLLKPIVDPLIKNTSLVSKATDYFFYDLSGKISIIPSAKDYVYISFYHGNDRYSLQNSLQNYTAIDWGNSIASMQWRHIANNDISHDHSLSFSNYGFNFETAHKSYLFGLSSGAKDFNYKGNLILKIIPNHKIETGLGATFHNFSPTRINAQIVDLSLDFDQKTNVYSYETFAYASDRFDINPKMQFYAGLRYTMYEHIGPFKDIIKNERGIAIDTIQYKSLEPISMHNRFEPRVALRYLINDKTSLKASYTRNHQFIHLGALPSVSLPTDIWVPSSNYLKPQTGDQYTLGYFKNFKNHLYKSYVQVYYKHMNHQIEFKKGVLNSAFEQNFYGNITTGKGYAYGLELMTEKTKGALRGWVSYTLSRTIKHFEELNNGEPFPAKYDRIHDLSMVASYQLNHKWSFSTNFIFCTGEAITLPAYRYLIDGLIINEFTERNAYRMKNYHRLDVAVTYTIKKTDKFTSLLNLSIYNVYNRQNPFYLFYQVSEDFLNVDIQQVSLFPILPSINWSFEF